MTTPFSLRHDITTLSDVQSQLSAPVDPSFPYNVAQHGDRGVTMRARVSVYAKAFRENHPLFDKPTSIYLPTTKFREFFPSSHTDQLSFRFFALKEDLSLAADTPNGMGVTLVPGMVLVASIYDGLRAVMHIHFLRITGIGVHDAGSDGVHSFVNVAPLLYVKDTPEETKFIPTTSEGLSNDVIEDKLYGLVWGLLSNLKDVTTAPRMMQHLFPVGEMTDADILALGDIAEEEWSADRLEATLHLIYANRSKVFNSRNGEFVCQIAMRLIAREIIVIEETDEREITKELDLVVLPTAGVTAPSVKVTVPVTDATLHYLRTLDPAIPNEPGPYVRLNLFY